LNRRLMIALVVVAAVGLGVGLLMSRPASAGPIRAVNADGGPIVGLPGHWLPLDDAVRLTNRGHVAATLDSITLAPGSRGVTLVAAIAASPQVTPGDDFAAAERASDGQMQRIPGAIVPPVSRTGWIEVFVELQFASGVGPSSTRGYTISYHVGHTHYRTTASAADPAIFCVTTIPHVCQ
jgi:hypothetical protein